MTCNFSLYIILLAMCFLKFMKVRYMKTASLGLLELEVIVVVRVNAGGDAPPDPPLLVTRFGGRSIPEIYVPLIWIETKTLALTLRSFSPSLHTSTHKQFHL